MGKGGRLSQRHLPLLTSPLRSPHGLLQGLLCRIFPEDAGHSPTPVLSSLHYSCWGLGNWRREVVAAGELLGKGEACQREAIVPQRMPQGSRACA